MKEEKTYNLTQLHGQESALQKYRRIMVGAQRSTREWLIQELVLLMLPYLFISFE